MRVVAGEFGGRRLQAPAGAPRGRPPTACARRCSRSSGDVAGARVLDLFAGSGALGIEALSRGADVGRVRRAATRARSPRSGATSTRSGADGARSAGSDALRFLRAPARAPFDLVFVDPPYDSAPRLAGPLSERPCRRCSPTDARIVTESDKRTPLELALPLLRERTYGDTRIAIQWLSATAARPSARAPTTRSRWATSTSSAAPPQVFDNVIVGVVNQPVRKQQDAVLRRGARRVHPRRDSRNWPMCR